MRTSVDTGMATFARGQQPRHATTAKGDFGSLLDNGPASALPAPGEREPLPGDSASARSVTAAAPARQPAPHVALAAAHSLPAASEASPDDAIAPEPHAEAIAGEPVERRADSVPAMTAYSNYAEPRPPGRETARVSTLPPDGDADGRRGDISRASTSPRPREGLPATPAGAQAAVIAPDAPSPGQDAVSTPSLMADKVRIEAHGRAFDARPVRAEGSDRPTDAVGETTSAPPDPAAEQRPARNNREPTPLHATPTAPPLRGGDVSREAVQVPTRPAAPAHRRNDTAEHPESATAPPLAQAAQVVPLPRQAPSPEPENNSTAVTPRPADAAAPSPTAPPMSLPHPQPPADADVPAGQAEQPPRFEPIATAVAAPTMPPPQALAPEPHERKPAGDSLPAKQPEAGRAEHVEATGTPFVRMPLTAPSPRTGSARQEERANAGGAPAAPHDAATTRASGHVEAAPTAPTHPAASLQTGPARPAESANASGAPAPLPAKVAASSSARVDAATTAPIHTHPAASPRTGSARREESANGAGMPAPPQTGARSEQPPAAMRAPLSGNTVGNEPLPRDTHAGQAPPASATEPGQSAEDGGQGRLRLREAPGTRFAEQPSSPSSPSNRPPDIASRSADARPEAQTVPRPDGLEPQPLTRDPAIAPAPADPLDGPSPVPVASKAVQTPAPVPSAALSSMAAAAPASPPRSPRPSDPEDAGPHQPDAEAAAPHPARTAAEPPVSIAAPGVAAKPAHITAEPRLNDTPTLPPQAPSGQGVGSGTARYDIHATATGTAARPLAAAPASIEPPREALPPAAAPPSHAVETAPASADKPDKRLDGSAGFAAELTVAVARYALPTARQDDAEAPAPTIGAASPAIVFADRALLPPSPANALASAIATEPSWRPAPVAGMTQPSGLRTAAPPQTLQIQLNPDRLGMVTATLTLSGAQLTVELAATTHEAHERLKGEEHVIEKAIRGLGYDVGQVSITQSIVAANAPARPEAATTAPPSPQRDQASGGGAMSGGDGQPRDPRGGRNGNDGSGAYPGSSPRDPDHRRRGVYI